MSGDWPMEYAVTVVFQARDVEHAADVLDRCSTIAEEDGAFRGGWGEPFVDDDGAGSVASGTDGAPEETGQ